MIDRVVSSDPDLITVGFGMNEYWSPASQHGERIVNILDRLRSLLPETEFVLQSSMLSNRMVYPESSMKLSDFEAEYYKIQQNRVDLPIPHHLSNRIPLPSGGRRCWRDWPWR